MNARLRHPIGRVRGLGSAKDGTGHWWLQRVTAVALVPLVLILVVVMLRLTGADHATAAATIAATAASSLLLLLIGAATRHLKLGLTVVIEDYVHTPLAAIACRLVVTFGCIAAGLALAVARIAFRG